ncbi:cupin domain-containing protein [Streptacidiphilus sp. P02-A3a]|uniref:cupin domain-containing protein n=1 Tax=Streptacidiphilus sp. P02-A3a TaxID=2704468 RepID=UPI0015F92EFA|nr:cupin domain-containing protein [Streptacidiphilus sp. P02-A3a]QMU73279.1 hypothetical protein GXP74_38665 [Streptacidiphilus sp. P02-A3a]
MSPTRETPRVLAELTELVARADAGQGGALWRLAEPGRQLDANLVRLAPGAEVGEHVEGDLDVLLMVVDGGGELGVGHPGGRVERQPLGTGTVVWLPRGSRRSLHAGPDGLVYLTAHQRRPALGIKRLDGGTVGLRTATPQGGDAPCLLDRVCPGCDRVSAEATARFCGHCGTALPGAGS